MTARNWERRADAAYRISLLTPAQRRALGSEWLNWCEVQGIDPLAELSDLQQARIAFAELVDVICDALAPALRWIARRLPC